MLPAIIETLPFFLSSAVVVALIYYKIPLIRIQQIVSILLVVLLLILSKLPNFKAKLAGTSIYRAVIIFALSLFIQLLVISTGGFFSPLLIIIHIFTLGISFLLDVKSASSFLIFSLAILIINTNLNDSMMALFREDPASVILYVVSFLIIIPLSQTISRAYHIKDALSKKLGEYLKVSEIREESILQGLSDFVVITDVKLNILSANQSVQSVLKMTDSDLIKKSLVSVIPLFDANNNPATAASLQIENILKDRYTRLVEGFSFQVDKNIKPVKVKIQVRPIVGVNGDITQIVFVIAEANTAINKVIHADLDQAKSRQKAIFEQIKQTLTDKSLADEKLKLALFIKNEEDIMLAQELEDHPISFEKFFEDVAFICKKQMDQSQDYAKSFGVSYKFLILDDEFSEIPYLKLKENNTSLTNQTNTKYTQFTDPKWLGILIQKILDMAILICSSEQEKVINISLKYIQNGVGINIAVPAELEIFGNEADLLNEYYGALGLKTNLKFGSGLEGFIAKIISGQLKTPIEIRSERSTKRIVFSISVFKELG